MPPQRRVPNGKFSAAFSKEKSILQRHYHHQQQRYSARYEKRYPATANLRRATRLRRTKCVKSSAKVRRSLPICLSCCAKTISGNGAVSLRRRNDRSIKQGLSPTNQGSRQSLFYAVLFLRHLKTQHIHAFCANALGVFCNHERLHIIQNFDFLFPAIISCRLINLPLTVR